MPSDTRFDVEHLLIERRWFLFAVIPIFRRNFRMNQFSRVCWQNQWDEETKAMSWSVGLERVSGRPIYINWFSEAGNGVGQEARRCALELSQTTGLPLSDEIQKSI
jgi:hypothetical protein